MLAVKLRVKCILDTSYVIKNLKLLVNSPYGLTFRLQLCVFMCEYTCAIVLPWKTEDNLQEAALSYGVGPEDWTQVLRFWQQAPFTRREHLAGSVLMIFKRLRRLDLV